MTAIEWLHEKLAKSTQEELVGNINTYFKQAKELEKQQIIDARLTAPSELITYSKTTYLDEAEKYYYETFKKL
jgi:hypothetical protein